MAEKGDTVQQVKDRLSIVDVVSQYIKLERSGASLRARCPFHAERSPSFFVSPERGTYHCFGCGAGGDIFSFIENIEGLDFKGALKMLAEKAGVPLVYSKGEKKDETDRLFELMETAAHFYASRLTNEAKEYLAKRGLSEAIVQGFRLGWAGSAWSEASEYFKKKGFSEKEIVDGGLAKRGERGGLIDKFRNRIMFPIADSAGRAVAFSGRIFGEDASPEAPKYLNSPETPLFRKSRILYGFDRAKQAMRKLNCAVLVEGQMDLLASHQAGWGNTVAVSGTAFTAEHAALIKRMTENVVLALDADEAGIKAAGRAAHAALQSGLNVKVAALPTGLDPADLIQKEGVEAWKQAIRGAKDIISFFLDVLEERMPQKDKFRRAVEAGVLPFLADVKSPIAREQYIREIAERLKVSETAVAAAFAKSGVERAESARETPRDALAQTTRAEAAYGISLWLESHPNPPVSREEFADRLAHALGEAELEALKAFPAGKKEALRFAAERVHGGSGFMKQECDALLVVLLRERLSRELSEANAALHAAEERGDAAGAEGYAKRCKLLTGEIARLSSRV